jgi:SAM-dependent methyltransferase
MVVRFGDGAMRLNVCCGRQVLDGWTNVDVEPSPLSKRPPEIIADAKSIPLPDGCAEELMVIHGFEHFYRWDCDAAIEEWKRLLAPGGKLVLELPDLVKCCRNVLTGFVVDGKHPDQNGMWGLYGDPRECNPFMGHRWGWSPKTLRDFLKSHGFVDIVDAETQYHPAGRRARDMRIEARKQ